MTHKTHDTKESEKGPTLQELHAAWNRERKRKEPKKMLVSVINESSRVTDEDVRSMVEAVSMQLAEDVAPVWGLVPALEFTTRSHAKGLKCVISDEPDVPGAAGYHDEGDDGLPYIKVFTFEGAPILQGKDALSVTLSHEIIELTIDPSANRWADGKDGADYAIEGCDAPEGQVYEKVIASGVRVTVSNHVYPAFFDPKAPKSARLDHLGLLNDPFETPPEGYQIRRTEPGTVGQVFGEHRARGHKPVTVHPASGLVIVFGKRYPEEKKAAKVAKALRRRGNTVAMQRERLASLKAQETERVLEEKPAKVRPRWAKGGK